MIEKRNLPPARLPRKASADEYFILCVQYMLLGSMRLSFKAAIKALQGRSVHGKNFVEMAAAITGSSPSTFKFNRIQYALLILAMQCIDLAVGLLWPIGKFLWSAATVTSNFVVSRKNGNQDAADSRPLSDEGEILSRVLARTSIPGGLGPDDYLRLGKQYKQNGWVGQAQEALERAYQLAPSSAAGMEAEAYLRTKVPRARIPLEVEAKNVRGYHAVSAGDLKKAREIFEPMMLQYPDFEWSYLNLATAYMKDRQLDQARYLLRKLLSINPDHVEAWDSLARTYACEFDLDEAKSAITQAVELLPGDSTNLKNLIDCLAKL